MKARVIASFIIAVLAMPFPCLLYEFLVGFFYNGSYSILWRFSAYPVQSNELGYFVPELLIEAYFWILALDILGALLVGIPVIILLNKYEKVNLISLFLATLLSSFIVLFVAQVLVAFLLGDEIQYSYWPNGNFIFDVYNFLMVAISSLTFISLYFYLAKKDVRRGDLNNIPS